MEKLNETQQEFYMDNIGLVYFACNKYNLDFSLACIGFCKAILTYKNNQVRFSTYAIKCMRQEHQNQYKKQRVKELTNFDNIEQYGGNYWNGECWEIDSNNSLYPIYREVSEGEFEVVGYEIK